MDITAAAALAFSVVTAGVILFQLALALGAPWGAYAMGGAFPGRFPPAMRVAALVQAALLGVAALVVLAAAGLVMASWSEAARWLSWGVVALSLVAVVLNAISPSAGERRLWVPVTLILLVTSLVVALTARP